MIAALFAGQPGFAEVLVVLVALLLLFGAKRIPEIARSLGKSLSEFKRGREEGKKTGTDAEDSDTSGSA